MSSQQGDSKNTTTASSGSGSSFSSTLKYGWKNLTGALQNNNKNSSSTTIKGTTSGVSTTNNSTTTSPNILINHGGNNESNGGNVSPSSSFSPPTANTDQQQVKELVEKINVLQVQLFMVTKEKQQLAYRTVMLERENQELQKLASQQVSKNVNLEQTEKKIDSLISKYEKVQEANASQYRQLSSSFKERSNTTTPSLANGVSVLKISMLKINSNSRRMMVMDSNRVTMMKTAVQVTVQQQRIHQFPPQVLKIIHKPLWMWIRCLFLLLKGKCDCLLFLESKLPFFLLQFLLLRKSPYYKSLHWLLIHVIDLNDRYFSSLCYSLSWCS